MLVSSSEEPLYTAVVEQCRTGGGTVGENYKVYGLQSLPTLPPHLSSYNICPLHLHTCSYMHKHTYTGGGGVGEFLQITLRILVK